MEEIEVINDGFVDIIVVSYMNLNYDKVFH